MVVSFLLTGHRPPQAIAVISIQTSARKGAAAREISLIIEKDFSLPVPFPHQRGGFALGGKPLAVVVFMWRFNSPATDRNSLFQGFYRGVGSAGFEGVQARSRNLFVDEKRDLTQSV